MEIVCELNHACEKLVPLVEEVFLFDDDELRLILSEILVDLPDRTVGERSFGARMCSQISFYPMPNGKVCAVAYPSSVKVDWDEFDKDMRVLFKHVERNEFSGSMYGFLLTLIKNGCVRRDGKGIGHVS